MEGAEEEEEKITEFIESKEIIGGKTNLNIAGKANKINIKGGSHILKISSHVDTLTVFAGFREINIKSSIENLNIYGGVSKIYVHNFGDAQVNHFNITGGNHEIIIYSFVNELTINGGVTKIICNYEHSKINKIKTIGGQREIFLNENTDKAIKENDSGTCTIQKTEIVPEPIWYQDSLSDNTIPVTILSDHKLTEPCTICLNEFKSGEKVYFLPCIHYFHKDCLKKWVKDHKKCPTCKFELRNKLSDE